MQTVTVSLRVPRATATHWARLATELGIERPTLLKRALNRGARELMFERACQAYRTGEATLSKAALIAGLSLRDMIGKLKDADVELNYSTEELRRDLQP